MKSVVINDLDRLSIMSIISQWLWCIAKEVLKVRKIMKCIT